MAAEKVSHDWVYHNSIDRHRPVFMSMQGALFIIGVMFWVDAMGDGVGFKEETWGWLAYSFPAAGWAFLNMATSAITMIGLMRPVRNWMVIVGASSHIAQFLILSYSAVMCGGVFVIGLYASVFFLPMHLWILLEALRRD
jgi:hypothetical protein